MTFVLQLNSVLQIIIFVWITCIYGFSTDYANSTFEAKEARIGNYTCKCQWMKDERVNFEDSFGGYLLDEVDSESQKMNCSLSNFGITNVRDGEWECRTFVRETEPRPCQDEKPQIEKNSVNVLRNIAEAPPRSASVKQGAAVTIPCKFSHPSPWCYWTKGGEVTAIEGRYAFSGNKDGGDCSITISDGSMEDNGEWNCNYPKTSRQDKIKSSACTVLVLVLPTAPVISINGIGMKNGQKIYITGTLNKPKPTTTTENYYRYGHRRNNQPTLDFPPEIVKGYVIVDDVITCWSLNGHPAPQLRWEGPEITGNNGLVMSSKTPKLFNARIQLPSDAIYPTWQQTNLTCHSHHPGFTKNQLTNDEYSTTVQILLSVNIN